MDDGRIAHNSNMTPRLWGQNCKFFSTPLSRNSQNWRLEHNGHQTRDRKMTRKPQSHVRILKYRTWTIGKGEAKVLEGGAIAR